MIHPEFLESFRLIQKPFQTHREKMEEAMKSDLSHLQMLLTKVTDQLPQTQVIINTLAAKPLNILGPLDRNSSEYIFSEAYEMFNLKLSSLVRQIKRCLVFDLDRIVRMNGWNVLFDVRMDYLTKSPFSGEGLKIVAEELGHLLKTMTSPSKKCIVLDLDNTLWGGVVGEEGMKGIVLNDDGPGKAYYDFQQELKNLSQRGILLAIASKNNFDDALEIIDSHPKMVLRKKDFAAMRINWTDKAANIASIAQELNLGLNSFLYIDDSAQERSWISQALPEVEVVELPGDPACFTEALCKVASLDTLHVTVEDKKRSKDYQQASERQQSQKLYATYEEYLDSLQMEAIIKAVDDETLPRIVQLINKTNQFNLTTLRRSEAEINRMMKDRQYQILHLSVKDRFGDYGIVGVAIVKKNDIALIDTFLLSCRVLSRGAETAFLAGIVKFVREEWECSGLEGQYVPTAKNSQTADFYPQHGFECVTSEENRKIYRRKSLEMNYPRHIGCQALFKKKESL